MIQWLSKLEEASVASTVGVYSIAYLFVLSCAFCMMAEEAVADVDDWRQAVNCGPNATYIFARAHGLDCSLTEIYEMVDVGASGASLGGMSDAVERLGGRPVVVKTDLTGLRSLFDLPIIIQRENPGFKVDHFEIVTELDESSIVLFDPLTLIVDRMPLGQFERLWTGYALVWSPRSGWPSLPIAGLGAGCMLMLVGFLRWRQRRSCVKEQDK